MLLGSASCVLPMSDRESQTDVPTAPDADAEGRGLLSELSSMNVDERTSEQEPISEREATGWRPDRCPKHVDILESLRATTADLQQHITEWAREPAETSQSSYDLAVAISWERDALGLASRHAMRLTREAARAAELAAQLEYLLTNGNQEVAMTRNAPY